jgi:hypothetical protein
MPSQRNGQLQALLGLIPGLVNIASSTHTTPITVTTATPHGMKTNDTVVINGHITNTAANGSWGVMVTDVTHFQLIGSVGNGTGGATGTARSAGLGSSVQVVSGTDPLKAASFAVGEEALTDRDALLMYLLQYRQTIWPGGIVEFMAGSTLKLDNDSLLWSDGANFFGTLEVIPFSTIQFDGGSVWHMLSGANATVDAGAGIAINGSLIVNTSGSSGLIQVDNNGQIVVMSGGLLDIKGDGTLTGAGDIILRSGALLEGKSGSLIRTDGGITVEGGATVDLTAAALDLRGTAIQYSGGTVIVGSKTEATANTFTGAQIYSGAGAYRRDRQTHQITYTGGGPSPQTIGGADYDMVEILDLNGFDQSLTLNDPPDNPTNLRIFGTPTAFDIHTLTLKNQGGATITQIVGTDAPHAADTPKWVDLRFRGSGTWTVTASYAAHS